MYGCELAMYTDDIINPKCTLGVVGLYQARMYFHSAFSVLMGLSLSCLSKWLFLTVGPSFSSSSCIPSALLCTDKFIFRTQKLIIKMSAAHF